jgi:myo-inositol-hexaphosphate 3-phosphohydrolase
MTEDNKNTEKQCDIHVVMPRFFVDERNGCVAIRDRTLKDPDDNGCDADKIDVVKFAMGDKIDTGKFITWDIDPKIVQEFRIECALLNEA